MCEILNVKCIKAAEIESKFEKYIQFVSDAKKHMIKSNIGNENVRETIMKTIIHSLFVCTSISELLKFVGTKLSEKLNEMWHCFVNDDNDHDSRVINWFDCALFMMTFNVTQIFVINYADC